MGKIAEFIPKVKQPEEEYTEVRLVGGTTAVTQVTERTGVTASYVSTGRYRLTWAENPGRHVGNTTGMSATTPGDIAGHSVVYGAYTASGTSYTMDVYFYDASDALHDLAALEWLDLTIKFKRTSA